jgi:glycosyltransferase involved in cell wall biosynthesis
METQPLISIVTIHFNHLDGLKRTASSILGQLDRKSFEWIVIDGGSTDGAVDFLRGLGSSIDCLISEKDGGIYDAMNKGLAQAGGEYVWFMNAGDTIHSANVVERLRDGVEQFALSSGGEHPDVIFGDTMFVESDGKQVGLISQLKPQPFPRRLHGGSFRFGMNVCHQSILVKRSLAVEYNLGYRLAADVDWIIRVLKRMRGESLRLDFVVSDFELGGSSYQHTKKAWKERYRVLSIHYGKIPNFFAHGWILFRRLLFNLNLLGKKSSNRDA